MQEHTFPGLVGSLHYVNAPADASARILALINKLVLKVQALIGSQAYLTLTRLRRYAWAHDLLWHVLDWPRSVADRPCINRVHTQIPQYHKHLRHVEPLPNLLGLMDAQATLDRLRRNVSLLAELVHVVGRAAALPAVLRSRALASLETGLRQRRHQLLLPDGCTPDLPQKRLMMCRHSLSSLQGQ